MSNIVQRKGKNSTSFQLFSFSKSSRFGGPAAKFNTEQNLPAERTCSLSKTATSLGQGHKMDISKQNELTKNAFLQGDIKGQMGRGGDGFGFGTPRAQMNNVLKNNLSTDKRLISGPGQQDVVEHQFNISKYKTSPTGYSKWSEKRFKHNIGSGIIVPGPQKYELDGAFGLKANGQQFLSQQSGSGATKINPVRSSSTGKLVMNNPGPGLYNLPETINEQGKYTQSHVHNSPSRTFNKSIRPGIQSPSIAPGPGKQNPCIDTEFIPPLK